MRMWSVHRGRIFVSVAASSRLPFIGRLISRPETARALSAQGGSRPARPAEAGSHSEAVTKHHEFRRPNLYSIN
jgi:hypothetical protein